MKKLKEYFLSVIVPVYNEEKRIKKLVEVVAYLKKQRFLWELIVIDDGSFDHTKRKLTQLKKKLRFKLISYYPNKGKGAAIKEGMLFASGKYRLFLDVDLSTPLTEFDKLLPHLKRYDIVIGSRKMKGSDVKIRQSITRELLGRAFTFLSQQILQVKISDFTCGFKCFSGKAAKDIFSKQTIKRWGFDSEIIYIGKNRKFSIKEIPVTWRDDPRTKVKFPQDIIFSLHELFRIRLNAKRGLYK